MDLPRAWTAFGGASLALMGTAIAAGARRHADDNLAWRREWSKASGIPISDPGDGRALVRAYRAGGALAALAGLGVVAAAAAGPARGGAPGGAGGAPGRLLPGRGRAPPRSAGGAGRRARPALRRGGRG